MLLILISIIVIAGCSIPEYYIDIHYPEKISQEKPFNLEIFVTNARYGTQIELESIYLVGELALISKLWPNRQGAYFKQQESGFITALLWRKLAAFETGCFSMTLLLGGKGTYTSTLTFYIDGKKIEKDIKVEVMD